MKLRKPKSAKSHAALPKKPTKADWEEILPVLDDLSTLRTQLLGANDNATLNAKSDLAITLAALGYPRLAVEVGEEILLRRTRVSGDDDPSTELAKQNLAEWYAFAGNFPKALEIYGALVDKRIRHLGDSDRSTVEAKRRLAAIEKLSKAYFSFTDSDMAASAAEGHSIDPDPLVLGILKAQARNDTNVLKRQRTESLSNQTTIKNLEALERKYLAFRAMHFGSEDSQSQRVMNELANTLKLSGQLEEARSLQEKVLAIRESRLGRECMDTLNSVEWLADTLHLMGNFNAEYKLRLRNVKGHYKLYGASHVWTANSLMKLARSLESMGQLGESSEGYLTALSIYQQTLGDSDPLTIDALEGIARVLRGPDLIESTRLFEQVLTLRMTDQGFADLRAIRSGQNLGGNYVLQKRFEEGKILYSKMLAAMSEHFVDQGPAVILVRNQLALTLAGLGRVQEALDAVRLNAEDAARSLGEDHPETLLTRGFQASLLVDLGEIEDATLLAAETLNRSRALLGGQHIATREAQRVLDQIKSMN